MKCFFVEMWTFLCAKYEYLLGMFRHWYWISVLIWCNFLFVQHNTTSLTGEMIFKWTEIPWNRNKKKSIFTKIYRIESHQGLWGENSIYIQWKFTAKQYHHENKSKFIGKKRENPFQMQIPAVEKDPNMLDYYRNWRSRFNLWLFEHSI